MANRWLRLHTDRMKRRWVVACAGVVILLLAGLAGWLWWPRPVAPGLTPQMVRVFDAGGAGTIMGGGRWIEGRRSHALEAVSRSPGTPDASRVAATFGISLVQFHAPSSRDSGTY